MYNDYFVCSVATFVFKKEFSILGIEITFFKRYVSYNYIENLQYLYILLNLHLSIEKCIYHFKLKNVKLQQKIFYRHITGRKITKGKITIQRKVCY